MTPSASLRDLRAATEAARLVGCPVHFMPPDFHACGTAHNALSHIPDALQPTPALWIGYILDFARYKAIYEAAHVKNIVLLNTPREHLRVQEADGWLPLLDGLTPSSRVVQRVEEYDAVTSELRWPLFVKGAVQSREAGGWRACVAENLDELRALCGELLALEARSRGRVIVRELVALRHTRHAAGNFPMGREYRAFVLNHEVLALGYYWEGDDELKALTPIEHESVANLARLASQRLNVPYLAVDIAQTTSGEWIVIEVGDAQFCGRCQIPPLTLWHRLRAASIKFPLSAYDLPTD